MLLFLIFIPSHLAHAKYFFYVNLMVCTCEKLSHPFISIFLLNLSLFPLLSEVFEYFSHDEEIPIRIPFIFVGLLSFTFLLFKSIMS